MAGPREAVGCWTLICRKVDSSQLNDRRQAVNLNS